jgi:hypothetical protein
LIDAFFGAAGILAAEFRYTVVSKAELLIIFTREPLTPPDGPVTISRIAKSSRGDGWVEGS